MLIAQHEARVPRLTVTRDTSVSNRVRGQGVVTALSRVTNR